MESDLEILKKIIKDRKEMKDKITTCRRCGKDMEHSEIHLFRGGEERRHAVEKLYKTKVTLCANPPPKEFWKDISIEDLISKNI